MLNAQLKTTNIFGDIIHRKVRKTLECFGLQETDVKEDACTPGEISAMRYRTFSLVQADKTVDRVLEEAQNSHFKNKTIYGLPNPDYGLYLNCKINHLAKKHQIPISAVHIPEMRRVEVSRTN